MEKMILKLAVIGLLAIFLASNAPAVETVAPEPNTPANVMPLTSKDFRIAVQTNKKVYHNRDALRLTVKLLNDSPRPVFIGVCPIKPESNEPVEGKVEELTYGFLDDAEVDVAIIPRPPLIIGYATLTRLGPSPVPTPVLDAEDNLEVKLKPKKFRLPLFGSPSIAGHSTRIISAANILITCPLLEVELEPVLDEIEPVEVTDETNELMEEIKTIPAIGRCIPVKPGYYLLDCRIEKICDSRMAQAQKIIQIKRRIPRPKLEP